MPPRKKAKVSSTSSPRDSQPKTPLDPPEAADQRTPQPIGDLDDPWTDEQEIELFKSIIRFKPTGIHKHFHMLSISNSLASHGITTQAAPHTNIPGIWKKLNSLYDLAALDEREYAHAGYDEIYPESPASDAESEEGQTAEFALPWEDYGELMWQRRFAPSPSTSEPEIPNIAVGKEDRPPARLSPSVVIDIEGSQAAKRATKAGRSARGRPAATRGRTVSSGKGARGAKQETPQEEAEEESADDDEEEVDEAEATAAPAKRGKSAMKSEKPTNKAAARRSTRRR